MTLRRLAAVAVLALGLMFTTTIPALAQTTPCGTGVDGKCTSDQVGPFMAGVSVGCGNRGDCTLVDIETVIANIGNWILGIVGSLVLLFYIWGGIQFLTSAGDSGRVKAGKESLKKATLGLVIVFIAFIAINTLKDTLLTGSVGGTGGTFIQCTGAGTAGQACEARKVCDQAGTTCIDTCLYKYPNGERRCLPKETARPGTSCETNMCSDPNEDVQCCLF